MGKNILIIVLIAIISISAIISNSNAIFETPTSDGVPAGSLIMGDTETPPSGYTYTGNHLRAENLASDWTRKAPMPTARSGLAVGVVNNKIYAIGGMFPNGTISSANEEYNPITDMWTIKTSMPTVRTYLSAGVVNNKIYAIGGMFPNGTISSANEEYNPVTDVWITKASLPTPLFKPIVTVSNGKIYAMAANNLCNYEYDPVSDTWTTKANSPLILGYGVGVAVNDKIYVFGTPSTGMRIHRYSPDTNIWEIISEVISVTNIDGNGFIVSAINNKTYIIGGNNAGTNEEYDPGTNTFTARTYMPTARMSHAAGVVNNKIYAIGGTLPDYSTSSANEEYSPPATYYIHRKDTTTTTTGTITGKVTGV